jgi:hypothetical protein
VVYPFQPANSKYLCMYVCSNKLIDQTWQTTTVASNTLENNGR